MDLHDAFDLARDVLSLRDEGGDLLPDAALEIAVLERTATRRCFRRVSAPLRADG